MTLLPQLIKSRIFEYRDILHDRDRISQLTHPNDGHSSTYRCLVFMDEDKVYHFRVNCRICQISVQESNIYEYKLHRTNINCADCFSRADFHRKFIPTKILRREIKPCNVCFSRVSRQKHNQLIDRLNFLENRLESLEQNMTKIINLLTIICDDKIDKK